MPSKISDLVSTVVSDKKVTREEWEGQLKPQLQDAKKASAEMREVLELWANDEFQADDGVRSEMRGALTAAGYDIPYNAVPKKDLVQGIVDSNVTEVDKDFAVLLAQTGKAESKTTIAVLDAGFQLDHPALQDKEWTNPDEVAGNGVDDDQNGLVDDVHGWDFAQGDADVSGDDHGSHVSGIATRGTDRVQEIACRIFEPFDVAKAVVAIDYACANGARAINMSFKVDEKAEVDAIKAAMARHPDVLFVKSAGNDGNKLEEGKSYGWYDDKEYGVETYLPMNDIPNMVVVASADAKGERADYSNFALPYVTVAARGSEVFSSVSGGRYESMDGTSMAAPNTTAVVAKCLTLAPGLTPYDVRQILIDTTDRKDSWKDLCVSGGLVNQGRATRLAALIGMVQHEGMDPQAAADKIELRGEERVNLLLLLKNYPVPAPVKPQPADPTPATDPTQTTPATTTPATDPAQPVTTTPATDPAQPATTTPATDPVQPTPVTTTPATDPAQPATDPAQPVTTTPATDPAQTTPATTTTTGQPTDSARRRGRR